VVLIARDVTARRQLERRVAEQAAELEAIFEAMADGVAVYDPQGRFVRANSALRQLFGFDADPEYTARPLDDRAQRLLLFYEQGQLLSLEQWPQWRVLRGEILAGASAVEGSVRTVDGRELWVSTTGAPVYGPDGQVTGTVLITRDVTARRALERRVREQAAQLETVFAAMTDGVFVLDVDGHVTRMNPAARELLPAVPGGDGRTDISDTTEHTADALAEWIDLRDAGGRPLPDGQRPTQRVLRGEVLAGDNAVTLTMRALDGAERTISVTGGAAARWGDRADRRCCRRHSRCDRVAASSDRAGQTGAPVPHTGRALPRRHRPL
jgi:PAS domain-containing protein